MQVFLDKPDNSIASVGRLGALHATSLMGSSIEPEFDRITNMVCRLLNVPVSLITLIDIDHQFFKSQQGLPKLLAEKRSTQLDFSICKHVVQDAKTLAINDTKANLLTYANPIFTKLRLRAYLGAPVMAPDGHVIGAICAVDKKYRNWTPGDKLVIEEMSQFVVTEIALRLERVSHPSEH